MGLGLTLALALTTGLALEALRAVRGQRRSAMSVLTSYARLGAEQFARNAELALDYGWAFPVFRLRLDQRADPATRDLMVRTQYGDAPLGELVQSFFELSLAPDEDADVVGGALDGAARALIREASTRLAAEGGYHALVVHEEPVDIRLFFVGPPGQAGAPDSEDQATTLRGFEAPAAALERILRGVREREPALPPVLTDGTESRQLLSITVRSPRGSTVFSDGPDGFSVGPEGFSDGPDGGAFTARTRLAPQWGGFEVEASIPPKAAAHLVLGGVPASRVPVLLAMLVFAAATLASFFWVLRRERELIRLRERFVTGASHELRTPLAQIRMFSETLRLGRVRSPDEHSRYLEALDREARRLSHLVDNLLEFSRDGGHAVRLSRVAIRKLLFEASDAFAPLARERGATLEVDAPEGLVVEGDRDLLRQVLFNLLDNATKHGPADQTVTLSARLTERGGAEGSGSERADWIEISVSDQGPGVAPAHRDHVWERFWRAPGTKSTGFGVGLAVVRDVVERHGGEVAVGPAEGTTEGTTSRGARFSVFLRAATQDAATAGEVDEPREQG
jgi:signal transduction histidine kinase